MEEILNLNIQDVEIAMKKKGFSELCSANDSETDNSEIEQIDEGFSDISSANQDEQDDSNNNSEVDTEND